MKITSTLIEKFLAGECDPDETEKILEILAEHPGLLETYIGETEWQDIGLAEATMPEDARRRIHSYVMQHTAKKNRATVVTALKWVAAASIIFVLGWGGWQWFQRNERAVEPVAKVNVTTSTASTDTLVTNNNSLARRILLKDGSEILLSAHSTIQYQPAFNNKERVIYLKGEAFFKVAKDKQRPFTVYSHGIATTALGTSFTIRALENESTVKVILHTGKVMVQRVAANGGQAQEGNNPLVYLLPGDQLAVNILTYQTTLTHTKPDPAAPGAIAVPQIPATASAPLHFDRTPLAEVFQKLQLQYQTVILYDEAALSEMSFTGQLQPTESLESVLQKIAFLNELIVTKTTEGYHIRVNH